MNQINNLPAKLQAIKEENQDFEWYPTTSDMIEAVFKDVKRVCGFGMKPTKLMDIGAGDGNLFRVWDKLIDKYYPRDQYGYRPNGMTIPEDYYAIEKSKVLINYLPKDVVILGTDFYLNTLIDKQMDFIFCNPPYSSYEKWAEKVILEGNTQYSYLVIPSRWTGSKRIQKALTDRRVHAEVIYSGDFLDAPRQARASVDIVKITYKPGQNYKEAPQDPFDLWYESMFGSITPEEKAPEEKGTLKERAELVPGANLSERLEELYIRDMYKVQGTYSSVQKLDPAIMEEFGISVDSIKSGLKNKLKGLKTLYWKELFSNMDELTNRLTSATRKKMLDKLQRNQELDFSSDNIYAVVTWAMKNANAYFDEQLITAYQELVSPDSVTMYKSNQRFMEDGFKFTKESYMSDAYQNRQFMKHADRYYLNDSTDYRIVAAGVGGIFLGEHWRSYDQMHGLTNRAFDYVNDLCVIARNLGYSLDTEEIETEWASGKIKKVYIDGNKKRPLFVAKAFKNQNMHFKFDQEFLRKWNVEYGRLMGWINNRSQASEELNLPEDLVDQMFGSSHHYAIGEEGMKNLLPAV